ncbi:tyrosine-type recombinase/integrase [Halorhabdus amylolytica]|uniref:tyrosine-type recombinase/integrase n=1 Tax=Halorhabdus amylolytica TaxID=2559573 RepID=UPI0020C0FDE9|nr:tyrosine-type recombinase/integrase [Halorhabdus amylolytica]
MGKLTRRDCDRSGARAQDDLHETLDNYLDSISSAVPVTTYRSHKSQSSTFYEWYDEQTCSPEVTECDIVVQFAQYLFSESGCSTSTIRGYISTVANALAYHHERDPEILTYEIASALCASPESQLQKLGDQLVDGTKNEDEQNQVPRFLANLRQRHFGTRAHAYVELLVDTKGRPEQIRQIDLADLDLERSSVTVGVPDTHLVSVAGLVTERVTRLTATTVDAVETYIEYERPDLDGDSEQPVFSTRQGRVSPATLRRSIKQMSESSSPESAGESRPVVPHDIWQYAMSTILEQR